MSDIGGEDDLSGSRVSYEKYYIDTSIVIAFMDLKDPNHSSAVRILNGLGGVKIVSDLVFIELISVYARAGFEDAVARAIYSIETVGAVKRSIDFNKVLRVSAKYGAKLKLRTLDLLHIVSSYLLGADAFITLDRGIIGKSYSIQRLLGIKIISPLGE